MCILLEFHYAKFDVSRLFCSKVIEEKSLGGRLDPPPLVKEGLTIAINNQMNTFYLCYDRSSRK